MTEPQYTHQIQIFAPSSVSLREVEQEFPFRDDEGIVAQTPRYTCIFMVGDLNDEQVKWLTTQKSEGKIKGWQVDPIRGVVGQGSGRHGPRATAGRREGPRDSEAHHHPRGG